MTRYLVIETFAEGCLDRVYQRFHSRGRMLPEGLIYLDSWLEKDGRRCFQLMQTDNVQLFKEWTRHWEDLTQFEIIELGPKPDDGP